MAAVTLCINMTNMTATRHTRNIVNGLSRTFHSNLNNSHSSTVNRTFAQQFPIKKLKPTCQHTQTQTMKTFSMGIWTSSHLHGPNWTHTRFVGVRHFTTGEMGVNSSKVNTPHGQTDAKTKTSTASTLKSKRSSRVNVKVQSESHMPLNIVGYAVGKEMDLHLLKTEIEKEELYTTVSLPEDVTGTLLAEAKFQVNGFSREMFIFQDGAVVCWNMLESEQLEVLKYLQNLVDQPNDLDLILNENEGMYAVMDSKTVLIGDTMHLNETLSKEEAALEKFAFSNAIAQSAKLSVWEKELERFTDSLEPVTENLKDGRKTKESGTDILRKLGKMFTLRHEINLESDLLGVPEVYWERESLETLYRQMHSYLNITKRTKVMNEKLEYCKEVLTLINGKLSDQHHVRLEWYIIILILVEVMFEIVRTIPWTKISGERPNNGGGGS